MFLIVGLGNPGKKYQNTRHNIGSQAVDEIATNFQFSPALLQKGGVQTIFNAKISKGTLNNQRIILVKPQTFMNESGKTVKKLIQKLNVKSQNLVVVHDDIDLPLGKIRIVKNRGAGGHKGVESIIKGLGTKNFVRFRVGIMPKSGKPKNPERFVLQKFNKEEKEIIEKAIKNTAEAIKFFLEEGLEKATNKFNK